MSLWERVAVLRSIRISRSDGSQCPAVGSDAGRTIRIDSGEMGWHSRPGKGEFPASWSDAKIISEIESIANDATLEHTPQPQPAAPVEAAPEEVRVRGDVKGGLPAPEAAPSDPSAASVLDKLYRYTLNPEHLRGKEKAAWFEKALGYSRQNINNLAKQIVFDEAKAVKTGVTQYGTNLTKRLRWSEPMEKRFRFSQLGSKEKMVS
jgi:hypothetical protein